jgi:hypothetical protein
VVLSNAGAQVPVIALSDVVGNGAKAAPEHIGATAANVGVTAAPTTPTFIENRATQPFASLTVMLYGPAARFKKILLAWNTIPSLL